MKTLKERITENPLTSVIGGVMLLGATAALIFGKIDTLAFAELSAISLLLLGLKDPAWVR